MHSSLGRVKGEDNNMVYAVYRLTHLSSWKFLQHFQTHYPQGKPKVSSPPSVQVQATDDYHAAQQATTQGLSSTVFQEEKTVWWKWHNFFIWLHTHPDLQGIEYPIPFLHIFTEHVCAIILSEVGASVNKRPSKQYLWSIGKIFASMGANDLQHNNLGKFDFRLGRQLATYVK